MKKEIEIKAKAGKGAAAVLASARSETKNEALKAIAAKLISGTKHILSENKKDISAGKDKGLSEAFIERLTLNEKRIKDMAEGLSIVAGLNDPVGSIMDQWKRPNGLHIKKVRVPIGLIGIIYESRPNVTVDAAALCLKAGNAVILKGGSDAINSNKALASVIQEGLGEAGLPDCSVSLIESTDRAAVKELLNQRKYIDCIIPRGGAGLIQTVVENSRIPVIETGVGNCHAYVEASADHDMAESIVINAKTQRPSVCNAIETLLVDEAVAEKFVPRIVKKLKDLGVEVRGCSKTMSLAPGVKPASEDDYFTEFLALILAVKVVSGIEEAVEHIAKYGSHHSETIITENKRKAAFFTSRLDSAAVYVNASTRFTDGFEFGFGSEIGISTQKLHARGPMGLAELTSYKYVIEGTGQIRK